MSMATFWHATVGVAVRVTALAFLAALTSSSFAATIVLEQGDSVKLDQLVGPGGDSILVGDKLFDNFEFGVAPLSAPFDVTADEVTVTGIFSPDGSFGISFLGGFVDFAIDDNQVVYSIEFDVTATDPDFLISAVELTADPRVDSGTPGLAQVTEDIFVGGTTINLGTLQTEDTSSPGPATLIDEVTLAVPQSTLSIDKSILLLATDGGPLGASGNSSVTLIDQVFRQVLIPEPSTSCLLAIATGVCVTRRRAMRS